MKISCVTAICGRTRGCILRQGVPYRCKGLEFVCFTDLEEVKSDTWRILPAYDGYKVVLGMNQYHLREINVRNAKHHKVMIHEHIDCDCSLWIDSNTVLKKPISEIMERYMGDSEIVVFPHWERINPAGRNCAYKEAQAVLGYSMDHPNIVMPQMAKYMAAGYPKDNGLSFGGFILRRHTENVKRFNCAWWDEIRQHSRRDQLSLDYCLWKTGLKAGKFCGYFSEENDFVEFM